MKKVAVTGASGFIGRRVVEMLQSKNCVPVQINRSAGIDILGPKLYYALDGCDAVIHPGVPTDA